MGGGQDLVSSGPVPLYSLPSLHWAAGVCVFVSVCTRGANTAASAVTMATHPDRRERRGRLPVAWQRNALPGLLRDELRFTCSPSQGPFTLISAQNLGFSLC